MHNFDPEVLKFTPPDRIPEYMKKLHPGMAISHDKHHSLVPGYIHDIEWNFFDEMHRNFVHDTYHDMYKIMAGKYFSVNVVRWGNLPIFIQVANAKIKDGLFYQSMVVLGVIFLHQIVRLTPKEDNVLMEIDWYIASHWLFRWLHHSFNKRLMKLQKKQDHEDNVEIRARRLALRKRGFSFLTDKPDFINSNLLNNHVKMPSHHKPIQIFLKEYLDGQMHRVDVEGIEFMLKHKVNDEIEIWPAICPHEGALMNASHLCAGIAVCPWHGRRFSSVMLNSKDKNQWQFLNVMITHHGEFLEIRNV
jgi:hypothetical protein